MWRQADSNSMNLKPMTEYGCVAEDNNVRIIWDSQKNVQSIRERVHVLLRGCKCITGCTTGRCSCRRKQKECGEGCQCLNCSNINTVHDKDTEIDELVIEESQGHNNEINDEVEELMDWVFGEDAHSRVSNNIDSEEEDTSM